MPDTKRDEQWLKEQAAAVLWPDLPQATALEAVEFYANHEAGKRRDTPVQPLLAALRAAETRGWEELAQAVRETMAVVEEYVPRERDLEKEWKGRHVPESVRAAHEKHPATKARRSWERLKRSLGSPAPVEEGE
jgi:type II secretory pathway component PulJ